MMVLNVRLTNRYLKNRRVSQYMCNGCPEAIATPILSLKVRGTFLGLKVDLSTMVKRNLKKINGLPEVDD